MRLFIKPSVAKFIVTILLTAFMSYWLFIYLNSSVWVTYSLLNHDNNPCPFLNNNPGGPLCISEPTNNEPILFIAVYLSIFLLVALCSYTLSCCLFTVLNKPHKKKTKK